MARPEHPRTHRWLKDVGLYPHLQRHNKLRYGFPCLAWTLTGLGSILVIATDSWESFWWVPASFVAVGILSSFTARYARHILYHKIVCPHCGDNPTRRKGDGKPRKDEHKMLAELERCQVCRVCGDESRLEDETA